MEEEKPFCSLPHIDDPLSYRLAHYLFSILLEKVLVNRVTIWLDHANADHIMTMGLMSQFEKWNNKNELGIKGVKIEDLVLLILHQWTLFRTMLMEKLALFFKLRYEFIIMKQGWELPEFSCYLIWFLVRTSSICDLFFRCFLKTSFFAVIKFSISAFINGRLSLSENK